MSTGRPSKLTQDVFAKIISALEVGNYRSIAAKAAGVGVSTFLKWMAKGKEDSEGVYRDFREAVLAAEAVAEVSAVAEIASAGKQDPKHLQWLLSRKHPERWGDQRALIQDLVKRVKSLEDEPPSIEGSRRAS